MATHYQITSAAGVDMGTFEAQTRQGALDALARDQGYRGVDDACEQVEGWDQGVRVEEVDPDVECAYCHHSGPASLAGIPGRDEDRDGAWAQRAAHHDDDCEWISTRAHTR